MGGSLRRPHYSKCYALEEILLLPIHTPPEYMAMLQDRQNAELRKHLRLYNAAFAFTSTRVQSVGFELGLGVHTYKVQGGFYHLIGGMEPSERQLPCFLQAYVHDVVNESPNRQMQNPNLSSAHLMTLRTILRRVNPYVNVFVRAVDRLAANPTEEVHICITTGYTLGNGDVHRYNAPMANEVAMIIHGEPGEVGNCDVIIQRQYGGGLQRMNELAPSYDPLQYSLLFLAREDGWSENLRL